MINDIYKSFVQSASGLGNYQALSKTELANGYCDADEAGDEVKRSQYISALMLRYWYKVYEWNKEKNLKLTLDDFVSWLYESFEVAFKYRRWRDPNDKLYNDPNGPDKVFNRAFYSTRNRYYDYFNKDKRRINFYAYSLEESVELHGDAADGLAVIDNTTNISGFDDLIQSYVKNGKLLEAVILNNILYESPFNDKVTRVKTGELDEYRHPIVFENHKMSFDIKKLIKSIVHIDDPFITNFTNKYDISLETIKPQFENIQKISNKKLTKNIQTAMLALSKDKDLKNILC